MAAVKAIINGTSSIVDNIKNSSGTVLATLSAEVETETKEITANGTYTPSTDGFSSVTVNVNKGITPTGTKVINANGTYDVTEYASAEVAVDGGSSTLVEKSITENGTYSASDDSADGYSKVTVNVSGSLDMQTVTDDANLGTYGGVSFNVKTSGVYLYSIRPKTVPSTSNRAPYSIIAYIDNDNSHFRAGFVGYTGAGYTTIATSDSTVVDGVCTLTGTGSLWLNKGLEYEVTELPISSL